MVRRQSFINKIRELDYTFKSERKRVYLWRKGLHFIPVPKSDLLDYAFVANALRQAGVGNEEIQIFLGLAKN
jgi:hypothetical protein